MGLTDEQAEQILNLANAAVTSAVRFATEGRRVLLVREPSVPSEPRVDDDTWQKLCRTVYDLVDR